MKYQKNEVPEKPNTYQYHRFHTFPGFAGDFPVLTWDGICWLGKDSEIIFYRVHSISSTILNELIL